MFSRSGCLSVSASFLFLWTAVASTISKFPMTVTLPDGLTERATGNRDIRYDVWSNPQRILYRLDDLYNETEKAAIREAMAQITRDMSSCIRFEPYNVVTDSREDHLVISPRLNAGTAGATCITFPGRVIRQNAAGQKLVIFQSANGGCLGTKRETMAILVPVLGVRQEYKRPDRDLHIRVFPNNILPAFQSFGLLTPYEPASVDATSAFDFFSITMPTPDRFAKPNTIVYAPRNESQRIGEFARLSQGDCQGIKKIYPSCTRVRCSDPYAGLNTTIATTSPASAVALKDFNKQGAGTVIGAAFSAINKAVTTPASARVTTTPLTLLSAFQSNDPVPLDPPFGGLEFWLDPTKKEL